MFDIVIEREEHKEYITWEEACKQSNNSYMVCDHFGQDLNNAELNIAEILYCGTDEYEAKKIWLEEPVFLSRFLFTNNNRFRGEFRFWADLEGTENKDNTECVNYRVIVFYGESKKPLFLSKDIIHERKDEWVVMKIVDVDLIKGSLVGEIAYRGINKQEAVDIFYKSNCKYYIFNPFKF